MNNELFLVSWNVTQRCNLRCKHCYIDASAAEAENELSTQEGLKLIDEIAQVNHSAMLILTGGEPLLRSDIFQLAEHAAKKELMVVLGTNATLIDEATAAKLKACGVKGVGISLDSIDAKKHDSFRGVQEAWEHAIRGIEAIKKAGMEFQIQTTATKENYDEVPEIVELAHSLGARVFNLFFLVCTGRGEKLTDISAKEYERLLDYVASAQKHYRSMLVRARCAPQGIRVLHRKNPASPFVKSYIRGCLAALHYCRITPHGEVTPCPYFPLSAGSVREQGFAEIWKNSKLLKELREAGLKGKCGACEYRVICGGCRARAYALSGDYAGEDLWCEYEPVDSGAVTFETEKNLGIAWSSKAEERIANVPFFLRGVVRKEVEKYAHQKGLKEVTPELLAEVKQKFAARVKSE